MSAIIARRFALGLGFPGPVRRLETDPLVGAVIGQHGRVVEPLPGERPQAAVTGLRDSADDRMRHGPLSRTEVAAEQGFGLTRRANCREEAAKGLERVFPEEPILDQAAEPSFPC
jgi:hypothetical protein